MRKKSRLLSLLAVLVSITLLMASCTTPGVSPTGKSEANQNTGKTGDFSLFGNSSASPAASVEASAAPTEAATPAPTPEPTAAPDYICHAYTATDGTYIYYFPGDGIHRMNMDGSGDQVIVGSCYNFLGINGKGLYYLEFDPEYKPVGEELEWQWCLSYNLMVYDTAGQTSSTIQKHVYKADQVGGFIYFVDHANHLKFVAYDMATGSMSDVAGLPSGAEAASLTVDTEGGKPVFGYWQDDKLYECEVRGNAVGEPKEVPMGTDYNPNVEIGTDGGMKFQLNYDAKTAAVWTGSAYSDLGLHDVTNVLECGANVYVLTQTAGVADANGKKTLSVALFEVRNDGSIRKAFEGPSHTYENEGFETFEVAGGWLFSFWVEGDGGTASELLLKQKLN